MRVKFEFYRNPVSLRFNDSMNAAIVAGLAEAGVSSDLTVGANARPWTFAMEGSAKDGGLRKVVSITVSTPDPEISKGLLVLTGDMIRCASSNGDTVYLGGARRKVLDEPQFQDGPIMMGLASPMAFMKPKKGREKTSFIDDLEGFDLSAAISGGLSRRAGRDVSVKASIDPLSMKTDLRKHIVALRKSGKSLVIRLPAFSAPITLEGAAEDLSFAYAAGIGAKTHAGFGCLLSLK